MKTYFSFVLLIFIITTSASQDTLNVIQLEKAIVQTVRAERTLPVTETSLDKTSIEQNYAGQEMPAFLSKTPSVTWYSDGGNCYGYSYMRLRGIDQSRINFTLNGVPLNEPEDQGAYFSNYPDFLNSVGSIQVQRGVGISSNGTASFAGSVNIESPSLNDSAYTALSADYGSYHTYRFSPEFHTGMLKNNWSIYGRYSGIASDGFREHSGTEGQSFFFSGGHITDKGILKCTTFLGTSKNQMAYLAVADSNLKKNFRQNDLTENEKDEFLQSTTSLQYIFPLGKYSLISSTAYYTYLSGGYSILFPPDLYRFSVKSDFAGGILNYQFSKKHFKLNSGLHVYEYKRYHSANIEPDRNVNLYKNAGEKREISSFLKTSYTLAEKLTLFVDLQYRFTRFDYHADQNAGVDLTPLSHRFVNPKAGISYLFKNKHIFYFSTGQLTREPTRNDLFAGYDNADSSNISEIGLLDRVKPETVTDLELGAKLNFRIGHLDLNFYEMEFKNEIAAIGQLSYIGLPLRKNVPSSYRRGIELYMILQPAIGLTFISNANFSRNRIKTYKTDYDSVTYQNVKPLLSPELVAGEEIKYQYKWLQAGLASTYTGKSFLSNSNSDNVLPAALIFNGSLQFFFYKIQSITFRVNNIFDKNYYGSGYVQGNESYYFVMAKRNYTISLKLLL